MTLAAGPDPARDWGRRTGIARGFHHQTDLGGRVVSQNPRSGEAAGHTRLCGSGAQGRLIDPSRYQFSGLRNTE